MVTTPTFWGAQTTISLAPNASAAPVTHADFVVA